MRGRTVNLGFIWVLSPYLWWLYV